jgi:uncharacterized protein YjfI (DUF2170 family)
MDGLLSVEDFLCGLLRKQKIIPLKKVWYNMAKQGECYDKK